MSSIIIRTADQTKRRLCEVLNEIKRLNLDSVDQMTTTDETIRLHQERRRITQEKIMHIQIYIEALESVNTEWKQFIQQISVSTKRKEEEDRYLQINDDESGREFVPHLGHHKFVVNGLDWVGLLAQLSRVLNLG
ncbi:Uncharacterized protein BM_BM17722 [Brugia malayi]|nr:Uncharacterized protein BM_BM17722 [Brugia malayi]VIO97737.1 Uncharacterized protein BM_BM17722 [Brugia malayi]